MHYENNNELFEKRNIITKGIPDLNSPALLCAQKAVFKKLSSKTFKKFEF